MESKSNLGSSAKPSQAKSSSTGASSPCRKKTKAKKAKLQVDTDMFRRNGVVVWKGEYEEHRRYWTKRVRGFSLDEASRTSVDASPESGVSFSLSTQPRAWATVFSVSVPKDVQDMYFLKRYFCQNQYFVSSKVSFYSRSLLIFGSIHTSCNYCNYTVARAYPTNPNARGSFHGSQSKTHY